MGNSTVGINLRIQTQGQSSVEGITQSIDELNKKLKEAHAAGKDFKEIAQLHQALESAYSGRSTVMSQMRQAESREKQSFMDNPANKMMGGQMGWMFQNMANQLVHGILSSFDIALSAAKMRASGDYTGASIAYQKGMGGLKGGGAGAGIGMGVGVAAALATDGLLAPLIPILTSLGNEIGKFAGEKGAKEKEVDLEYSQQYKNALPGIDSLNRLWGGAINAKTLEENNEKGLALRSKAVDYAKGTGLDTEAFIELANKMSAFGLNSADRAMGMAHNQAMWSRFTGVDAGAIQKHDGTALRYRGEGDATAIAYGGLKAQNMEKGQFSEYLTAMERIMEDGIAKGFAKSSKEIAGNLTMLYELSGKSAFWQGEQGAQKLSQMNASISSAAALETPAHDIAYASMLKALNEGGEENREANFHKLAGNADLPEKDQLVYTDTYIDVMQLLAKGVSGPLMNNINEMVRGFEKGNTAGQIQFYKQIYGLNDIGAAKYWSMTRNLSKEDFESEYWQGKIQDEVIKNKNYASDSNKLQDIYNDLNQNLAKIGKLEFDNTEIILLRKEAENLAEILRGKQAPASMAAAGDKLETVLLADATIDKINATINPYGGGATAHFLMGMNDLVEAEKRKTGFWIWEKDDINAQDIGRRFNNEIVPFLPENPGEDLLRLMNTLNETYYAASHGGESGWQVGPNEYRELTDQINQLKTEINRLHDTVGDLERNGIKVHGTIDMY
jgi:hypothetical protein